MEGFGRMVMPDGEIKEGYFKENIFQSGE